MVLILIVVLVTEILSWSMSYTAKSQRIEAAGGLWQYISLLVRIMVIPEVVSAIIITLVINLVHRWFKVRSVAADWFSVAKYELSFLPVLGLVYFLFIPFTQSIRYLLAKLPAYSFSDYWNGYILTSYTWPVYFVYLLPVLLLGYSALNLSLLIDFLKQDKT